MDYGFKKRFKKYDEAEFVVDGELVEIYYSNGWGDRRDTVMLKPLVIERVTPKKIFYRTTDHEDIVRGGQEFKEEVGLIKSNNLVVAKEDADKAVEFMLKSYREEYEEQIAKLQEKVDGINNAVVKRIGEAK